MDLSYRKILIASVKRFAPDVPVEQAIEIGECVVTGDREGAHRLLDNLINEVDSKMKALGVERPHKALPDSTVDTVEVKAGTSLNTKRRSLG